jgi:tRNA (guanine-N7-)-methyltransferase
MGHNKLRKFAEVAEFTNVFEPGNITGEKQALAFSLKGKWNKEYFKNENQITLELGCGRGEYTVGLARLYPNRNFIGMDVKGARLWKGAKIALEENLTNVAFIRSRIETYKNLGVENNFAENEINEIWIPFPDPYPKKERKRLVSFPFIERYRKIAPPGTVIHLKTDNSELYSFAMEEVKKYNYPLIINSEDIYNDRAKLGEKRYFLLTEIKTYYEKQFLKNGLKINYLEFSI